MKGKELLVSKEMRNRSVERARLSVSSRRIVQPLTKDVESATVTEEWDEISMTSNVLSTQLKSDLLTHLIF